MAAATAAKADCAGLAPSRQLSGRSGQSIQQPACNSNSPGMRKPWRAGVAVRVRVTKGPSVAAEGWKSTGPSDQLQTERGEAEADQGAGGDVARVVKPEHHARCGDQHGQRYEHNAELGEVAERHRGEGHRVQRVPGRKAVA